MNAERLLQVYEQISEAPDAIARLRRFVLDLAVRGKLVEQDAANEPAIELLDRIAEKKVRLFEVGAIKKKPELPPVARCDQPHPLPSNWIWVRFANIVDFSAGRTPSRGDTSYWNTGDFHWVSIADMVDGQVVSETKETVSEKAKKEAFKSDPAPAGTMIMSFKLTIGKMSRLGVHAYHNEAIISIRPHLAELDPYLFKVLPDLARGGETKGAIKGVTLNRESISNILIPLPPLAEQHRIVAKVDELMALCDRLEEAGKTREELRDKLTAASLARLTAP
ncbi:restriction endonuclease subunit S, partial [Sulfitobacter sp. HI0023]|uniref:restriction endonuclease subunit S n=5 Tax=unclassified Sulfitobacter TaxID=196795 RepID=UPI000ABA6730